MSSGGTTTAATTDVAPTADAAPTSAADRGQTTIDYAVGISVFLLIVAFVFAFAPSLTTPFTDDATDATVVADRSADRLVSDLLVDTPTRPSVLNATCTADFFDTAGADADCRFDTDSSDLKGALGVASPVRTLNVTVDRTVGPRLYAAGPTPPRGADLSVSRRAVLLDGDDAAVTVRVW